MINFERVIFSVVLLALCSCATMTNQTDKNFVEMEFVEIPKGQFEIGSPPLEADREKDENQALVLIPNAFELQQTEVTQYQWFKVTGKNPALFSARENCVAEYIERNGIGMCPNHPVENVTFRSVQEFLIQLNRKDSKYSYRLPTEAEWEYAARAGSTTSYFFGNDVGALNQYAWFSNSKVEQTQRVKSLKPNPWGLYDIYGNVFEFVSGGYVKYSKESELRNNGPSHSLEVARGGGWYYDSRKCRSASRYWIRDLYRSDFLGLRLIRKKKIASN